MNQDRMAFLPCQLLTPEYAQCQGIVHPVRISTHSSVYLYEARNPPLNGVLSKRWGHAGYLASGPTGASFFLRFRHSAERLNILISRRYDRNILFTQDVPRKGHAARLMKFVYCDIKICITLVGQFSFENCT